MKKDYISTTTTIAEIGINHNGDLDKAKRLIDVAGKNNFTYVKFQKRTPEVCVPEHQKTKMRKVPWREEEITYLQYKKDTEFSIEQYKELNDYAYENYNMLLFASIWDKQSASEMAKITNIAKIPSALITDLELLIHTKDLFDFRMLSTGMSTEEEIETAIEIFDPHVIFHTDSEYPSQARTLRLSYIKWLKEKYPNKYIGYSNHYDGIVPCLASIVLGAEYIEVHICEDKNDWGTDQSSSLNPKEVEELADGIKVIGETLGRYGYEVGYQERKLTIVESNKRATLSPVDNKNE